MRWTSGATQDLMYLAGQAKAAFVDSDCDNGIMVSLYFCDFHSFSSCGFTHSSFVKLVLIHF